MQRRMPWKLLRRADRSDRVCAFGRWGDHKRTLAGPARIPCATVHTLGAAVRAWRSYRGAGVRTRAFLAARLLVLPLRPLGAELQHLNGRVLSVGAGHGLLERFLAELNPDAIVTGLDLNPERARIADATRERAPRVEIRAQDVRSLDED